MNKERLITLSSIILVAAFSRLLPHPENVAPIAAIALFAGAYFERKWLAFAVPMAAMFISDVAIGFHNTFWAVYIGFVVIVCLGFTLSGRVKPFSVVATTLVGSVLFFVITNFGVWLMGDLYPPTNEGLIACFTAAIPFFTHSLIGDLFYAVLLFGGFALAEKKFSWLQIRQTATA